MLLVPKPGDFVLVGPWRFQDLMAAVQIVQSEKAANDRSAN